METIQALGTRDKSILPASGQAYLLFVCGLLYIQKTMSTLLYMLSLLAFLFLGILIGKVCAGREWIVRVLPRVQTLTLWLLLFMMGVSTGSIEDILGKLSRMGLLGLVSAILAIIGSVILTSLLMLFFPGQTVSDVSRETSAPFENGLRGLKRLWHIVKEPFLLLGIVLVGIACGLVTGGSWFNPDWISVLLRLMMVIVGILLIGHDIRFKQLLTSPLLLFIPLCTIAGSLGAGLVLALFSSYTPGEAMAITSVLGWYSLSGVMITDLGLPLVGTVALLSNLMRETLAFFLIPLLSRFGQKMLPQALTSAAATTMDVTLPLMSIHFGPGTAGISIYNGVITSLAVPLLIPLVLRIGA